MKSVLRCPECGSRQLSLVAAQSWDLDVTPIPHGDQPAVTAEEVWERLRDEEPNSTSATFFCRVCEGEFAEVECLAVEA
jgi:Zn finger protein HypA/HybF involved in hydrogenase expression